MARPGCAQAQERGYRKRSRHRFTPQGYCTRKRAMAASSTSTPRPGPSAARPCRPRCDRIGGRCPREIHIREADALIARRDRAGEMHRRGGADARLGSGGDVHLEAELLGQLPRVERFAKAGELDQLQRDAVGAARFTASMSASEWMLIRPIGVSMRAPAPEPARSPRGAAASMNTRPARRARSAYVSPRRASAGIGVAHKVALGALRELHARQRSRRAAASRRSQLKKSIPRGASPAPR